MFCRLGGKLPPTHIEPQRYIYIFIHFSPGAKSSIYLPTKDAANCVNRICSRGFRFVVFVEFKMTLVNVSRSMTSSACIHNVSTSPWSPLYEAMALCAPEMSYLCQGGKDARVSENSYRPCDVGSYSKGEKGETHVVCLYSL